SYEMTLRIIDNYYRDFLTGNIQDSLPLAKFAMKIVEKADKELYKHLDENCIDETMILPWIMTWFSQNKSSLTVIWRVFDFIIKNNLVMPYYIAAQKILTNRSNLMTAEWIHTAMKMISSAPETKRILTESKKLFKKIPPSKVLELMKNDGIVIDTKSRLATNIEKVKLAEPKKGCCKNKYILIVFLFGISMLVLLLMLVDEIFNIY
ncbi:hypothetical protein MHBO_001945, partial [Bonamia ostreae]